jgi:alkaline phosphatase
MRRILLALLLVPAALGAQSRAKNVILFLADAGGTSTVAAASLHGYGEPRRLYVQRMPHIGLSETSSASQLVTDSAAGMTAIVTGERTHNGVIAQSDAAVRGESDGEPLKSILEYAEERGLSTGIITNDAITGATPAALYAKSNDRRHTVPIFRQVFTPRFGDGVDVLIGMRREAFEKAFEAEGVTPDLIAQENGRPLVSSLADVPAGATRAIVLVRPMDTEEDFDLAQAVDTVTRILSKNRKGYFLMVEWDTHANPIRRGLDRMVEIDRTIEKTAQQAGSNTLVVFTADHSFDIRIRGGRFGEPLLQGLEEEEAANPRGPIRIPALRMENGHSGEAVLVAARGPGAPRVRGYMANTDLFQVMMAAYGWEVPRTPDRRSEAQERLHER